MPFIKFQQLALSIYIVCRKPHFNATHPCITPFIACFVNDNVTSVVITVSNSPKMNSNG